MQFLPGQWLDVYVPGVEKAGGFTITSAPREARKPHPALVGLESESASKSENQTSSRDKDDNNDDRNNKAQVQGPYLELAVQKSPDNAPAAWLWRDPPTSLLGAELGVRVGGSFVWPPPGINVRALRRVVFVAGGVGVNPLMSMLSSLASPSPFPSSSSSSSSPYALGGGDFEVHFLYSLRDPGAGGRQRREARKMLFLDRIARIFREDRVKGRLEVFLTGTGNSAVADAQQAGEGAEGDAADEDGANANVNVNVIACGEDEEDPPIPFHARRCTVEDDVIKAVGGTPAERRFAVVYVCGVPTMTDEFVARLTDRRHGLGMEPHRVLCEKWW